MVPYAGRVFEADEVVEAVRSTLDFWLTLGVEGECFESSLAGLLGVKHSLLVNSGSSANLVAFSALTSHKLPRDKRIMPGDEVITVAGGFPTTVTPIIQYGACAVFVDNDPTTGNVQPGSLEEAYVPGKTKAVMLAHTLGNPFDIGAVLEFCRKYDLWLVEDNCDALGSTYSMPVVQAEKLGLVHLLRRATERKDHQRAYPTIENGVLTAYTGCWGDLSTQSFYPPHHLTMGEGGAVNIVSRAALKSYAESFRDWGRDCWCASGKDDTCGKRFQWQLGELPAGYDHKYIYSHLGYNLKPLDMQAAIGRVQLGRLAGFTEARKNNWNYLRRGLADLEEYFEFTNCTHAAGWSKGQWRWHSDHYKVDPSWFGYMLRVKATAPFSRSDLARYLDRKKIGNRMLFGGNLTRQPAFVQLRKDRPNAFRVVRELVGADELMNRAIFLGVYPGLTTSMLDYVVEQIHLFVRGAQ